MNRTRDIERGGEGSDDEEEEGIMMMMSSSSSSCEIIIEEEEEESEVLEVVNNMSGTANGPSRFPLDLDSITEEDEGSGSVFSLDFKNQNNNNNKNMMMSGYREVEEVEEEDVVYVVITGKSKSKSKSTTDVDDSNSSSSSSMDALVWTLNHALKNPATALVFLVHVFPLTKFIPMPLGMIPVSQVNPQHRENYLAKQRIKRTHFLHSFINVCSASKVKVDTILIESDMESKAILDLIPILNIRKLVLGTTKSILNNNNNNNNKMKMRSRKGSLTPELIVWRDAPDFCDVKIICQGKQIFLDNDHHFSPPPSPRPPTELFSHSPALNTDTFTCCFKPKVSS